MNRTMEKLIHFCNRRGFVYSGSKIYGGLRGTFDYGPLGMQLKKNISDLWWKDFVEQRIDCVGLDSSIIPKKSSSNLARKKKPTVKEKTLTKGGRSSSRIKGIKAVDYATSNVIGASSAVVFEEEEVDENHIVFNDDNIEKYELSSEAPKPSERKANNDNKIDDWWFFEEECGGVPSLASVRKPGHFPKDAKTSVLLPSVNLKR